MAAKRRQGANAVPEERGTPWHLCHSVFGLFFSFSRASSSSTTVQSCSDSSPSLDALLWAPAAFQALAALGTGAGRADAGGVVCGGTGDGNLACTVSSCHWLVVLQTSKKYIYIYICYYYYYLKASVPSTVCIWGIVKVRETPPKNDRSSRATRTA